MSKIVAIRRANNFPTPVHFAESGKIQKDWYTPAICGSEVHYIDTVLDYNAFLKRNWKSFRVCSRCFKKVSVLDREWVKVVEKVKKRLKQAKIF